MDILVTWIVGLIMALLALLGLDLLSGALDTGITIFGSLLFVFGVGFDFWLLKSYADRKYEQHQ